MERKRRGKNGKTAQMEVKHLYFDADLQNVIDVQRFTAAVKDVEK